jgi:hypothetical protein
MTDFMGNTKEGYDVVSSDTPVFAGITGLGRNTVINSDAFGWMAHSKGNLTITDGTIVDTGNAAFLMKAGDVNMTVSNGAKINSKDGMILSFIGSFSFPFGGFPGERAYHICTPDRSNLLRSHQQSWWFNVKQLIIIVS